MLCDDVPIDTRFVFIDPAWVMNDAHANFMVAGMEFTSDQARQYFSSATPLSAEELAKRATSLPDSMKATPQTIHTTTPGTVRDPAPLEMFSSKENATLVAETIAAVAIQAVSQQCGDFIMYSYDCSSGTKYGGGAHMHLWTKAFAASIKEQHLGSIVETMNTPDGMLAGRPDFMTSMMHVIITKGLEGRSPCLGTSRLYPCLGGVYRTKEPMFSSRQVTGQYCDLSRTDHMLGSRHVGQGLMMGWESSDPAKPPTLYNFNVTGVAYVYMELKFDSNNRVGINKWATYVPEEDFNDEPSGSKDGFVVLVDGEPRNVMNMKIAELPSPGYEHGAKETKLFKTRRRRNIALQRRGRWWTQNQRKACERLTPYSTQIVFFHKKKHFQTHFEVRSRSFRLVGLAVSLYSFEKKIRNIVFLFFAAMHAFSQRAALAFKPLRWPT